MTKVPVVRLGIFVLLKNLTAKGFGGDERLFFVVLPTKSLDISTPANTS